MTNHQSLLRLKRFRIDDIKRRLETINAMKVDLEKQLSDIDATVAREQQRAGDSDIGRLAFPSFLRAIEVRRENLRATQKDIEREYEAAQTALTDAFQDLKALEVAGEQRQKRQEDALARRAQVMLDEVAIVRHLRKHKDTSP